MIKLLGLAWTLACLQPAMAFAIGPRSVDSNKNGLKNYTQEQYHEAFKSFIDALGADPFNPQLHLNLGDAFYKGGEYDQAIAAYNGVHSLPGATAEQRLEAYFNSGNAALQDKKVDRALELYQRALEISPGNQMVKTNIELALQQKQGGGSGDKKDNKDDNKDDKNQGDKKDQNNRQKPPQNEQKPKPQPFKSQDLSEGDVRRILEELKRQEEASRAKQYRDEKHRENPNGKDW